ncbi:MAG: protein kinase, partial [Planctomycetota bacterium]|nr:protein kinase [Planctomycetota bacterium]
MISQLVELAYLEGSLKQPITPTKLTYEDLKKRIPEASLTHLLNRAIVQDQITFHSLSSSLPERFSLPDGDQKTRAKNPETPSLIRQALSRRLITLKDIPPLFPMSCRYHCLHCDADLTVWGSLFPASLPCPNDCEDPLRLRQAIENQAPEADPKSTQESIPPILVLDPGFEIVPETPVPAHLSPVSDDDLDMDTFIETPANPGSTFQTAVETKAAVTINVSPSDFANDSSTSSQGSQGSEHGVAFVEETVRLVTEARELIGQNLGPWKLESLLGQGAMGAVYGAVEKGGSLAAVKVILPSLPNAKKYLPRFRQEAEVNGQLDHPRIAKFLGYSEDPIPYLALEYIRGSSLKKQLKEQRRFPLKQALTYIKSILSALDHAHSQGILHRDLKPDNVLLDQHKNVLLIDFGLARKGESDMRLTVTGQVMGTAQYMAPEQFKSVKHVGPEADLYSVGALLFHFLAGQPPFAGGRAEIIVSHVSQSIPDIRAWSPELPKSVADLIHRLLAKEPSKRYPSASATIHAIEALEAELKPKAKRSLERMIPVGVGDHIGPWLLEKELGAGASGKVFAASSGHQKAALKVLASTGRQSALARFQQEAKLMRELEHPNVVKIYDSGIAELRGISYPYMAMELFEQDLGKRVESQGPLNPEEAVQVILGAALALSKAHDRGVIHRDVKPENILLKRQKITQDSVCLTDFGVARLLEREADLTMTTAVLGSPFYMAPEQSKNSEDLDERADIYALGATLYYLLSASRMFAGDGIEALLLAHARTLPQRVNKRNPKVPEDLSWLVDYMVLKDREYRPQNAAEVIGDLNAWLDNQLDPERMKAVKQRVRAGQRKYRKRKSTKLWLWFFLVFLVLSLFTYTQLTQKAPNPFQTTEQLIKILTDDIERLQSPVDPLSVRELNEALKRAHMTGQEAEKRSKTSLPKDLAELFPKAQKSLDLLALREAEQAMTRRLSNPLRDGLKQDLNHMRMLYQPLEKIKPKPLWLSELHPRLESLKTLEKTLEEAQRLAEAMKQSREILEKRAYELALNATKRARAQYQTFLKRRGETRSISMPLKKEMDALEESYKKARSSYLDDCQTVDRFERQIKEAIKIKEASELVKAKEGLNTFLSNLPQGNGRLLARGQKLLLLRINLDTERAKRRLDAIRDDITQKPGAFHSQLEDLAQYLRDYPARLYPSFEKQARQLLRKREHDRDGEAKRQFALLCQSQDRQIATGVLSFKEFQAFERAISDFAQSGPLTAWSGKTQQIGERLKNLKTIQSGYGARLLSQAYKDLLFRNGEGHQAFSRRLADVESRCRNASSFPPIDFEKQNWMLEQVKFLKSLHDSNRFVALPGGAVKIGRSAPGFSHNPRHTVQLKPYLLDRFEVSVEHYSRFLSFLKRVGHNTLKWCPSSRSDPPHTPENWFMQLRAPKNPVHSLSLVSAKAFALWAGKRLPTEQEWEAAASRGTSNQSGPYAWGAQAPTAQRASFN